MLTLSRASRPSLLSGVTLRNRDPDSQVPLTPVVPTCEHSLWNKRVGSGWLAVQGATARPATCRRVPDGAAGLPQAPSFLGLRAHCPVCCLLLSPGASRTADVRDVGDCGCVNGWTERSVDDAGLRDSHAPGPAVRRGGLGMLRVAQTGPQAAQEVRTTKTLGSISSPFGSIPAQTLKSPGSLATKHGCREHALADGGCSSCVAVYS